MLIVREATERGEVVARRTPTGTQESSAYHVVSRRGRSDALVDPLRVALRPLGDALVVFTLERAATRCIPKLAARAGWRVRETSKGELVSLLSSLCGGVGYVLLDPRPEGLLAFDGSAVLMSKHEFVNRCLGDGALAGACAGSETGVRGSPPQSREAPGGLVAARGGALR